MIKAKYYRFERGKELVDDIKINDYGIMVYYYEVEKERSNCSLEKLYLDNTSPGKVLKHFVGDIYCPQYTREKFKNIVPGNGFNSYEEFEENIKNNILDFCSFYTEKELLEPLFNFGKFINNQLTIDIDSYFNKKVYTSEYLFYVWQLIKNELEQSDINKLRNEISKLVYKIGSPVKVQNNKADWTEFIFNCLLIYLEKERYIKCDDIYKVYFKILDYRYKDTNNYSSCEDIYRKYKYTDNKRTIVFYNIENILDFLTTYIGENYTEQLTFSSDIRLDEIEDYRDYLLNRASTEANKQKIRNYTLEELDKLLTRREIGY